MVPFHDCLCTLCLISVHIKSISHLVIEGIWVSRIRHFLDHWRKCRIFIINNLWLTASCAFDLFSNLNRFIFFWSRFFERVFFRVKVFGLEIWAHKCPGLLKLCSTLLVLKPSLHFDIDPRSGITPFFESHSQLFIPSFVSDCFILTLIPKLFDFLFGHIIRWIIMMIVGAALKSVLSFERYKLFGIGIESFKGKLILCSFLLLELGLCLCCHLLLHKWWSTWAWTIFWLVSPHRKSCKQSPKTLPLVFSDSVLCWSYILVHGSFLHVKAFARLCNIIFLIEQLLTLQLLLISLPLFDLSYLGWIEKHLFFIFLAAA